jgi:N-acyl homoserine lactone hydrolase
MGVCDIAVLSPIFDARVAVPGRPWEIYLIDAFANRFECLLFLVRASASGHGRVVRSLDIAVERVLLAEVKFPEWHPRFHEGGCSVFGYVIRHPDGVILFDTGVGTDNDFIEDLYRPNVIAATNALAALGIDERDVVAVVNSHLHFDHCGQNQMFYRRHVPIYAQAAEIEAACTSGYTVPEWAFIPEDAVRVLHGDEVLTECVRIVATPGHTPGHQSLVVETEDGPIVLGGQCVYNTDEIIEHRVAADNIHDDTFIDAAHESLDRLLALNPRRVVVAHDARPWLAPHS